LDPNPNTHSFLFSLLLKDRRRWTEESECEPIKIPWGNLAYIPKWTRRSSLLTRSRPYNYRKAIGPRNQIRNHQNTTEDNNWYKPRHVWDYDSQKWIKRQLKFSQAFHWTPYEREIENAVWVQFKLEKPESFNPATQEQYRLHPATIFTHKNMRKQRLQIEIGVCTAVPTLTSRDKNLGRAE
jgi:hypothetical protein